MRCDECGRFMFGMTLREWWWRQFGPKLPPPRPLTGFAAEVAKLLDRDVLVIAQKQLIDQLGRKL